MRDLSPLPVLLLQSVLSECRLEVSIIFVCISIIYNFKFQFINMSIYHYQSKNNSTWIEDI